jgi:CubicO group peptidase (beta-lactamase class C family)
VFQNVVGFDNLETRLPLRSDAIFDVRSLSKPVNAIGAMLLLESGKLSLEDPIERHLRNFEEFISRIQAGSACLLASRQSWTC